MLVLVSSMRQLRAAELMAVYEDSLAEKALDWPDLPRGFALELAEQEFRQYLDEVLFRSSGGCCAIWEENGTYVSSLWLEPYKDGLLLEALETLPKARNRGYALTLVRAVQEHLLARGPVKLYSHVDKQNGVSLRLHRKCGFRTISDHALYINGSVDYRCQTLLFEK